MVTKSSIILGLEESDKEIKQTMNDTCVMGVDILTVEQYLQPMAFKERNLISIVDRGSGKTMAYPLPTIVHVNMQPYIA